MTKKYITVRIFQYMYVRLHKELLILLKVPAKMFLRHRIRKGNYNNYKYFPLVTYIQSYNLYSLMMYHEVIENAVFNVYGFYVSKI